MGTYVSRSARWRTASSFVACILLVGLAYLIFFHGGNVTGGRELILYPGTYSSPNARYTLKVEIDSDKTVNYRVVEKENGQQAFGGNIGRADARWCLCWDGADNLWICGELDGVVYVRVPGSDFQCFSLRAKDYSKTMPPKFREFFSEQAREEPGSP